MKDFEGVQITDINGNNVGFSGDYPVVFVKYKDQKGMISIISTILSNNEINIATMKVTRVGSVASMVVETDSSVDEVIIDELRDLEDVYYVKVINVATQ